MNLNTIQKYNSKGSMESAKARGFKLGRPKKKDVGVKRALALYKEGGLKTKQIIEQTGISKSMFFRRLKTIES